MEECTPKKRGRPRKYPVKEVLPSQPKVERVLTRDEKIAKLEADLEKLERKEFALLKKVEVYERTHQIEYIKPYPYQNRFLEAVKKSNITLFIAPNKVGKSGIGATTVISWALGYEPWARVAEDYPGAVRAKGSYGDSWYKPSSLGVKPPVAIRITGEDWEHHVGKVIVPELKKWAPLGRYTTKKNNQGIDFFWQWDTGSTFEVMTYEQDDDLFESWLGNGWWADEPPPKSKFSGMSRGLFLTSGKTIFTLTPLKEAWILDELVNKKRSDVGVIDDVTLWDNPDLMKSDNQTLHDMGISPEDITEYWKLNRAYKVDGQTERFLRSKSKIDNFSELYLKLKIERFVKDVPEDERDARFLGKWRHLQGLIYKHFSTERNVVEPFVVPHRWTVRVAIDTHPRTEQALLFLATDERNIYYACKEVFRHGSPEDVADWIIDYHLKVHKVHEVIIEPGSKGDENRGETTFSLIQKALNARKITLKEASKDLSTGIRTVQDALKSRNNLPSLFVCSDLERTIYEFTHYMWDDWRGRDNKTEKNKPKDKDDHMMENLYRLLLIPPIFIDDRKFIVPRLPELGVV